MYFLLAIGRLSPQFVIQLGSYVSVDKALIFYSRILLSHLTHYILVVPWFQSELLRHMNRALQRPCPDTLTVGRVWTTIPISVS